MFDFGLSFSHIVVIVLLAVIVIGPKDLPLLLRRFGQFMNKMRGMARDFQSHVDGAMKDAGMSDIQRDLQSLRSGVSAVMNPVQSAVMGAAGGSIHAPVYTASEAPVAGFDANLSGFNSDDDFTRLFGTKTQGETRVQGRALDESRP